MVTDAGPRPLISWFGAALTTARERVALRIGQRELSYGEVHQLACTWAGTLLAALGREPGAVGVLAGRSPESYAGIIAALYAGATVVPLSPAFPPERTAAMARATRLSAVIADRRGLPAARELQSALPGLPILAPYDDAGHGTLPADPRSALDQPRPVKPSDTAYVLFTSGSTGQPKGVPVTHVNMDHFLSVNHRRYAFSHDDVFSQTFDQTFDLFMFDLFTAWSCGATLVSTPPQAFASLSAFIEREGLTVWFSVPSAISVARRRGTLSADSMPSLRWSLFCGEPLRAADAADWQRAASRSAVENLYGPTELTIACSAHRWSPDEPRAHQVNGIVPIGSIYPGLEYRVVDGEVPIAGDGELCVSGPQTFPGYLRESDNDGRFLRLEGRRWYRTGDQVRQLPGGELAYLGRIDHQIKIRGYRVEPFEIEACLREHADVQDAVAVPVRRNGEPGIGAFYTGRPAPDAALAAHLGASLPEFMVPRWFWRLESLPLSANRKTDRGALEVLAQRRVDGGAG